MEIKKAVSSSSSLSMVHQVHGLSNSMVVQWSGLCVFTDQKKKVLSLSYPDTNKTLLVPPYPQNLLELLLAQRHS